MEEIDAQVHILPLLALTDVLHRSHAHHMTGSLWHASKYKVTCMVHDATISHTYDLQTSVTCKSHACHMHATGMCMHVTCMCMYLDGGYVEGSGDAKHWKNDCLVLTICGCGRAKYDEHAQCVHDQLGQDLKLM